MTAKSVRFRCTGCDTFVDPASHAPFRCPRAGNDDCDHVVTAEIDSEITDLSTAGSDNPFIRYREWLPWFRLARDRGLSDDAYHDLVSALDDEIARVDGHRFRMTPYHWGDALYAFYKDETNQVSGSHKSRHLMGIALYLRIAEELGIAGAGDRPLAIASCGNAALAAAVIARAMDRELQVFVPPWAAKSVVERLDELGATQVVCERSPELPPGDPCVHHYRRAVEGGAVPFACQGNENGMAIAGGMTLAWELIEQHAAVGLPVLERIFVQVGGGALASSTAQAFAHAHRLGVIDALPKLTCVQTANAHPLYVAWSALAQRAKDSSPDAALEYARRHRSEFMRPWPSEPKSIASGILDDETYDWLAICRGLLEMSGEVVLADEDNLAAAQGLVQAAGVEVCATGASGYAGALANDELANGARIAVFFTGHQR